MAKYPIPGTDPGHRNCGEEFTVMHTNPGRYHCTRPPFHRGPHYDGINDYWWGFTEPERDPITRRNWAARRAAETAEELHRLRHPGRLRKLRRAWGLPSSSINGAGQ